MANNHIEIKPRMALGLVTELIALDFSDLKFFARSLRLQSELKDFAKLAENQSVSEDELRAKIRQIQNSAVQLNTDLENAKSKLDKTDLANYFVRMLIVICCLVIQVTAGDKIDNDFSFLKDILTWSSLLIVISNIIYYLGCHIELFDNQKKAFMASITQTIRELRKQLVLIEKKNRQKMTD